jgi:hypothetical protein
VIQFAFLGTKASFDISQAFSVGELGEGHASELIKTGELFDMMVPVVPSDATTESMRWQMIQHLRENESAGIHRFHLPAVQSYELGEWNNVNRISSR